MSRTLTSRRFQVSSSTARSSLPSASDTTSLGRRKPRRRNRGGLMVSYFVCSLRRSQSAGDRLLHGTGLDSTQLPAALAFAEDAENLVLAGQFSTVIEPG